MKRLIAVAMALAGAAAAAASFGHAGRAGAAAEPLGVTGLDLASDGTALYLLVGRKEAGRPLALEYLKSPDGGGRWSAPVRLGDGQKPPYRFEEGDARLAVAGPDLLAMWTAAGDGPYGTGPLVAALSRDGGRSWRPAPSPDGGRGTFGRRFVAVAADRRGLFHAVWIDRRDGSRLRYARFDPRGGRWGAAAELDAGMCECCWNAIAASDSGRVYALYRGKDPRDMDVAVLRDGAAHWSKGRPVVPFDWRVNICPHVGGALAIGKSGVHALVWTGADKARGLYHALSEDGGRSWRKPVPLPDPAARHSDLAVSPDGRLAAVWDRAMGGGRGVFAATSSDDGQTWSSPVALSDEGGAGAPRVAWAGGVFRALWLARKDGRGTWESASLKP